MVRAGLGVLDGAAPLGKQGEVNNGKREGVCVPKAIIHSHRHSWVLYSWCDKEMDSAGGSALRGERACQIPEDTLAPGLSSLGLHTCTLLKHTESRRPWRK